MAWIGPEIPGRPSGSAYTNYHYDSLPKITIQKEFAIFNGHGTLRKLRRFLGICDPNTDFLPKFPTACLWTDCSKLSDPILRDEHEGVAWTLEKNGRVYATTREKKYCVSYSIGEFLTRINIENALCFKFSDENPTFVVHLLQSQADYLAHYRFSSKRETEIVRGENVFWEEFDEEGDLH